MIRVLILLLLISYSAIAANHYVRPGGSGSANGTDWNNAYNGLPATLVRGDTYYVATGSYGSYDFNDSLSGTSRITIKKSTASDHGTDTGWQESFGTGTASFNGPFTFYTGYYVIDGATRNADWRSGYGIKINANGNNKSVDMSPAGSSSNVFRYVEIEGNGLDNGTHDDGFYAFGQNNLIIQYCYLHDFGRCPFLSGYNSGWIVEYCVIARNSNDPEFHAEAWAGQSDNNMTFRYSIWEDIEGTGIFVQLNRNGEINTNSNWAIYGNVFMYSEGNPYNREGYGDGAIAVINDQVAQNWKIYNNSFINLRYGQSSRVIAGADGQTGNSGIEVFNNFWWKSDTANHSINNCTSCSASYNRYDQTTSSGGEANREVNATAITSVFVDYSGKDFRLSAATVTGTNLSSPYNLDLYANVRGDDGVWDRGAYEYSTSEIPPIDNSDRAAIKW